LRCAACCCCLP